MQKDNRGRALFRDGIGGVYVKDHGYVLTAKRNNYHRNSFSASVKWGTKYYYTGWDNLTFDSNEKTWEWLNKVVDGEIDVEQLLNSYRERCQNERLAKEKAKKEASIKAATILKSRLDEIGITTDELRELYHLLENVELEEIDEFFNGENNG